MYEVILSLKRPKPADGEIMRCLLADCGVAPEIIVETRQKHRRQLSIFVSQHTRARSLKKRIDALHLNGIAISLKRLERADWRTRWKKSFHPFNVTKSLRVIPHGQRDATKRHRVYISIDSDLAFGTGLHPTTQLAAQLIEKMRGRFQTFLDIGTGSGILAIVAGKCGARQIWAIDSDRNAITTARANFAANGIIPHHLRRSGIALFRPHRTFELVAANLTAKKLVAMKHAVISRVRRGYYLVAGGISLDDLKQFRKDFESASLYCLRITRKKGWAALLYKKRPTA